LDSRRKFKFYYCKRARGGCGILKQLLYAFGGYDTATSATELYDGTSWTTDSGTMSTARGLMGSFGTQTSAVGAGGNPPPAGTNVSEEWTGPGVAVTKTITVS
jgi:hypothetical protein